MIIYPSPGRGHNLISPWDALSRQGLNWVPVRLDSFSYCDFTYFDVDGISVVNVQCFTNAQGDCNPTVKTDLNGGP